MVEKTLQEAVVSIALSGKILCLRRGKAFFRGKIRAVSAVDGEVRFELESLISDRLHDKCAVEHGQQRILTFKASIPIHRNDRGFIIFVCEPWQNQGVYDALIVKELYLPMVINDLRHK